MCIIAGLQLSQFVKLMHNQIDFQWLIGKHRAPQEATNHAGRAFGINNKTSSSELPVYELRPYRVPGSHDEILGLFHVKTI